MNGKKLKRFRKGAVKTGKAAKKGYELIKTTGKVVVRDTKALSSPGYKEGRKTAKKRIKKFVGTTDFGDPMDMGIWG